MTINLNRRHKLALVTPTEGFRLTASGSPEFAHGCKNSGLECYAIEALCERPGLLRQWGLSSVLAMRQHLLSEACVEDDDTLWWKWEKSPNATADFMYPIDWDDQFKAMDAFAAIFKVAPNEKTPSLPSPDAILKRMSACVYETNIVGEDIQWHSSHNIALMMFDVKTGPKAGNKEDLFVTAVAIDSGIRLGFCEASPGFTALSHQLLPRLISAAIVGLEKKVPFHTFSRSYISWSHYVFLLKRILLKLKDDSETSNMLVEQLRTYYQGNTPSDLERMNSAHDGFYARQLNLRVNSNWESEAQNQAIVFRHRRQSTYYSSRVWSSILRSDVQSYLT
jgi:hypothetical protein